MARASMNSNIDVSIHVLKWAFWNDVRFQWQVFLRESDQRFDMFILSEEIWYIQSSYGQLSTDGRLITRNSWCMYAPAQRFKLTLRLIKTL